MNIEENNHKKITFKYYSNFLEEEVVETIVFCCEVIETAFVVGVDGKVPLIILN